LERTRGVWKAYEEGYDAGTGMDVDSVDQQTVDFELSESADPISD
jgi:hypothetical protein